MIVTLTPNTGLDRVIFLSQFEWGQTIRATDSTLAMGGKGTDVSMVLAALDYPSLALGFAAGGTGQRMVQMLEEQGGRCDFVWVEGETRTNYVLIDTDEGQQPVLAREHHHRGRTSSAAGPCGCAAGQAAGSSAPGRLPRPGGKSAPGCRAGVVSRSDRRGQGRWSAYPL